MAWFQCEPQNAGALEASRCLEMNEISFFSVRLHRSIPRLKRRIRVSHLGVLRILKRGWKHHHCHSFPHKFTLMCSCAPLPTVHFRCVTILQEDNEKEQSGIEIVLLVSRRREKKRKFLFEQLLLYTFFIYTPTPKSFGWKEGNNGRHWALIKMLCMTQFFDSRNKVSANRI